MCGIAGIVTSDGAPAPVDDLSAMCRAMTHRGPDDEGIHVAPGVGLAMRRLSIIDVSGGHQPIANEDGSVWAVLNGEIYNYRELREELLARGHVFRTASDTETLVHLYEDEGAGLVDRLNGMFAFAVWDARARRLLLARDRLGIKPLYYTTAGGRFLFASELKALLALPGVSRRISASALNHLLTFLTTPREQSIVAGVRKLPPAHLLTCDGPGDARASCYWRLSFAPEPAASGDEITGRLRDMLARAVRRHMVSDVPAGAFLSGGIDSSTVVALMAEASPRPVKTFSVGFQEQAYDEAPFAREVARRFGTDHHETVLTPDLLPCLDDLVWHLDEPFGDSSAIPTYVLSRLARGEVKVALSGDGGDELFAGYDKYLVERRERRLDVLPATLRRLIGRIAAALPAGTRGKGFLAHRALAGGDRYLAASTLFSPGDKRDLLHPDVWRGIDAEAPARKNARRLEGPGHWLSALQGLDLDTYLPLDILTKVDRMSMAHSLEVRVPLLDHELVEMVARIPPGLHLGGGSGKSLLKDAMRGVLPESVLTRRKRGFAIPLGRWFRGRLGDVARDVLLGETSRQRGVLSPEGVRRLLDAPRRGDDLELRTWTLLSFELWCRRFLDRAAERPSA